MVSGSPGRTRRCPVRLGTAKANELPTGDLPPPLQHLCRAVGGVGKFGAGNPWRVPLGHAPAPLCGAARRRLPAARYLGRQILAISTPG